MNSTDDFFRTIVFVAALGALAALIGVIYAVIKQNQEDALPSMTGMQTILAASRLFAISDMLKILNDIIGNYPKFSSLVVNFNTNHNNISTSCVQFMIEELIPYSSSLNESKNVVKPDKSIIACNLLKSIAGLNQDKNQLNDQNGTNDGVIRSTSHSHSHSHSHQNNANNLVLCIYIVIVTFSTGWWRNKSILIWHLQQNFNFISLRNFAYKIIFKIPFLYYSATKY